MINSAILKLFLILKLRLVFKCYLTFRHFHSHYWSFHFVLKMNKAWRILFWLLPFLQQNIFNILTCFSLCKYVPWIKALLLTRLTHKRKNMGLAPDSSFLFQLRIIFPSRFELLWEQMECQPINGLLLHLLSYKAQWSHKYFNLTLLAIAELFSTCPWCYWYRGTI